MSKTLATAAMIVGGVALAATGAGALADAAVMGGYITGAAAATAIDVSLAAATVSSIAEIAAAGLAAVSALTAKAPTATANPMAWSANPDAGIPYPMGRCYVGGEIRYRMAYGKSNKYETLVTVLGGGGPHQSIDTMYVDGIATSLAASGAVGIPDQGKMYARTQLGQVPEPANLNCPPIDPYGWTAAHKLSGYAAHIVTVVYDTKGDQTLTTTPQVGFVGHWARVYDPRKDSTYPGGSGSHRIADESSWEWSDSPALNALTWLIGRRANGKLVLGVGCPTTGIVMSQYVEWANICQANEWKLGGVVFSTDDKYDAYKSMLQAGGAEPLRLGAQIGVLVNTPRVSLATVTVGDIVGDASVQTTQPRRDRINAIVPRYMAEQSTTTQDGDGKLVTNVTWGMVPAPPVVVPEYVAFDGRQRQREVSYPLVQGFSGQAPTQAVQLARYDIENAREFGPIVLPLKLRWMGYKPGDVVTVQSPEHGLAGQDILLLQRTLSPQGGTVTMTARSETAGKHPFALGQTARPPATPSVAVRDIAVPAPATGSWTLAGSLLTASGSSVPVLQITGTVDNDAADAVIIDYRLHAAGLGADDGWISALLGSPQATGVQITSIKSGTAYDVSIRYRIGGRIGARLVLGPVTAGTLMIDTPAIAAGAVTTTVRVLPAATATGTNAWIEIGRITLPLGYDAQVDITANAQQSYSSGVRDWGLRVLVDGTVAKQFSPSARTALTDILTIQRLGTALAKGSHTVTLEWLGADSTISVAQVDFAATRRYS